MRLVAAACLWAGALGCASAPPPRVADPAPTARALTKALSAGDADATYALLHPELRDGTTAQRFRERFELAREELRELGSALEHTAAPPLARAGVTLASGERVALILEAGRWRIAGGVFDAAALATPLDAVAELRHALSRRSLPALLRLLARERRAELEARIEAALEASADAADLTVEVNGDEAVVHLTGGGEVLLRREAGKWRLWDVR